MFGATLIVVAPFAAMLPVVVSARDDAATFVFALGMAVMALYIMFPIALWAGYVWGSFMTSQSGADKGDLPPPL